MNNVNFDYLPEKTRKADPVTFYELKFRIVRFEIGTDRYETILTNLDKDDYPTAELKRLIIPLRRRRQSGILSSNCPAGTAVP